MRLNPSVPKLHPLEEVGVALGGGVVRPLDLGGEEDVEVDSELVYIASRTIIIALL